MATNWRPAYNGSYIFTSSHYYYVLCLKTQKMKIGNYLAIVKNSFSFAKTWDYFINNNGLF